MNPILADTSFWVALINERNEHHREAEVIAARLEGRKFVVTDAILLEIGNVLARRFREEAAALIAHLLTSTDVQVVRLSAALLDNSLALYRKARDKEWSLVDCTSFIVMRDMGIDESLAFDKHFEQAGHRVIRGV